MDTATWAGVIIGLSLTVVVLGAFVVSIIPSASSAVHDWVIGLPDTVRELWYDVRSWWHHHGRHITGAPVHDPIECACELEPDDAPPSGDVRQRPTMSDDPDHTGATEEWSPVADADAADQEAVRHEVRISSTEPDADEKAILAALDDLVDSWRASPEYLVEWRDVVDEHLVAAGVDTDPHHRWRYRFLEVPTGELRILTA